MRGYQDAETATVGSVRGRLQKENATTFRNLQARGEVDVCANAAAARSIVGPNFSKRYGSNKLGKLRVDSWKATKPDAYFIGAPTKRYRLAGEKRCLNSVRGADSGVAQNFEPGRVF